MTLPLPSTNVRMKRTRWPLFAALLALALGALLATQIAWAQTDSVTVSVSDASATEGDSGRALMKFAVALSGSPSHDVIVHAAAWSGTATVGTWEDAYLYHSSRKIVFAANATGAELSRIVPVHVYGDTAAEDDETFTLQLTRIETSDHRVMFEGGKRRLEATGTIIDDDEDEQAVPQAPAPEAPTFRTVTGGANQATLTWTKPPGPITKYQYRAKRGSGAWNISSHPWTDIPNSAALETYTVTELKAGQWSFRLRAVNEAGDGEQAKPLGAVKVTELVPTNLAARPESSPEMALAGPTPMYVDLTWTAPEGSVTGYEYQYRAAPDGEWGAWTPIPNSAALTSYRVSGLDVGAYKFKLRAVNAAGAGPESKAVSATLLPRRPTAPANLTAVAGPGHVELSWDASIGRSITGYQVGYARNGEPSITWVSVGNIRTHMVRSLDAGVRYEFFVRAVNAAVNGAQASVSLVLAEATPRAAAPANLTARPDSSPAMTLPISAYPLYVDLTWTAPYHVTGYEYQYRAAPDGEWGAWTPIPNSAALTSYRVSGLDVGSYEFKLRAVNAAGAGAESAPVSATLLPRRPTAPANLTAEAGPGQVELSWDASIGRSITGYEIEYARSDEARVTRISVGNTTTYTVRSLDAGVRYKFFVRAVNVAVNGAEASVSAIPVAAAPSLTATAGPNRVKLNWTAPAGVITEYQLRYKRASDTEWGGWKPVGTATTHTLESLTGETEYQFTMRAQSIGGDGAESTVVSATPTTPVTIRCVLRIIYDTRCTRSLAKTEGDRGRLVGEFISGKRTILLEDRPWHLNFYKGYNGVYGWQVSVGARRDIWSDSSNTGTATLRFTYTATDGTVRVYTLEVEVRAHYERLD